MEDPDKLIDLLRQKEHPCDRLLLEAYDNAIHCNPRKHLHGGVAADKTMQMLYGEVIATPHPFYSPPKGPAGKKFIAAFANEWGKVRKRETNSE